MLAEGDVLKDRKGHPYVVDSVGPMWDSRRIGVRGREFVRRLQTVTLKDQVQDDAESETD